MTVQTILALLIGGSALLGIWHSTRVLKRLKDEGKR